MDGMHTLYIKVSGNWLFVDDASVVLSDMQLLFAFSLSFSAFSTGKLYIQ
jgi:hypothetical protein